MVIAAAPGDFYDEVEKQEFKFGERQRTMPQAEKVVVLDKIALSECYHKGKCEMPEFVAAAKAAGLSGRITVQLGAGLGGEHGMNVIRDKTGGYRCCRANVGNSIKRLGKQRFAEWLAEEGLTQEQFGEWFKKLP